MLSVVMLSTDCELDREPAQTELATTPLALFGERATPGNDHLARQWRHALEQMPLSKRWFS
jgi:hypothetical protein